MRWALLLVLITCNQIFSEECIDLNKKFDVIVVGAGVAGLSAAHDLYAGGQDVLVLEANDRIGGRIWSIDPWGSTLDLGAAWIHGVKDNPIGDLAKELHFEMIPTRYNHKCANCTISSMSYYDSDGKKFTLAEMNELKRLTIQFQQYLNTHSLQKVSVAQVLNQFMQETAIAENLKKPFHYFIYLRFSMDEAADLENILAFAAEPYSAEGAWGDDVLLVQGYKQLTGYLAKDLQILLKETVSAVDYSSQGVEVTTSSGHKYRAARVVMTVPVGVLKKGAIAFSPPLGEEKLKALSELEMSIYNKAFLFFPCAFWDNTEWIDYVSEKGPVEFMNFGKYMKQPILLGFTAGSFASEMENWDDQKIVNYIMDVLRKLYGDKIPMPSSQIITRWGKNPFSYGSYTHLVADANPETYEIMSKPIGATLFFAGEGASKFEGGTVYGAYMSGVDIAKQILELPPLVSQ